MVAARLLARFADSAGSSTQLVEGGAPVVIAVRPATGGTAHLVPGAAVATVVVALDGNDLVVVSVADGTASPANLGSAPLADVDLSGPTRTVLATGDEAGASATTSPSTIARVDPAAFGRYRMGCEITWIGAGDRAFLADLAAVARSGSPDQRRPDTAEVLKESRTEQARLQERFGR